jgi:phosphatidylglycerol---prolipoprotein diacylglyceryl transferase
VDSFITRQFSFYQIFAIGALIVGGLLWLRLARAEARLWWIYGGGVVGGLVGAKLAYLLAEGWMFSDHPQRWTFWLTGKSIMGALPGGWIGVEIAKRRCHFTQNTGDRFALTLPIPLMLGRFGCLQAGCCQGIETSHGRWPAVEVEMGFLAFLLCLFLILRVKNLLPGQHFHLFLLLYTFFRFNHEFLRATPKISGLISGYQVIAALTFIAALVAFRHRQKQNTSAAALCHLL